MYVLWLAWLQEDTRDMSWSTHINKVVTKAHQKLGFMHCNLRGSPQECKKPTFLALVRSGLEYASIIWDPYLQKNFDTIERIQWKAARSVISSYDRRTGVTKLLKPSMGFPTRKAPTAYSSRPVRGDMNKKKLFK